MTELSARQILEKLVSFPTVSSESNLPLIDWVEDYLGSHGIACIRVPAPDPAKAGLAAHVGPEVPGGIVLSGHTDVVPVEGQDWSSDPFRLTERDGRLYGRGTADMKGFDALAIAALVAARRRPLARPLQLALSRDEEIGCLGAPELIDRMRAALPAATSAVIGEPTMLRPVTGQKGCTRLMVTVRGYEVHSSLMHTGVSAVMLAARLIDWCSRTTADNAAAAPATPAAALFDPPYTTLHVGQIAGGTAHNITARECRFGIDLRAIPDEDTDGWIARVREAAEGFAAQARQTRAEAAIAVELHSHAPGLTPSADAGEAEGLVRRLTGDNADHGVSYGTEAGQFQERGYSAVICGPGDIAQAHQADEFLSIAQFEAGAAFLTRLTDTLEA